MIINKKEILGKKAQISYLQIFILILSCFAFAYIVYQSSGVLDNQTKIIKDKNQISNKNNNFLNNILSIIYKQLTKELLPSISADNLNCCPLDKQGSPCNDYLQSEYSSKCATSQPTGMTCNNYPGCKLGCCYSAGEGLCTPQSPKAKCEAEGGLWKDSADCNINKVQECKLGCCVVGSETQFVTEERCKKISGSFKVDFRAGITNEAECIMLSMSQDRGACVLEDGGCKVLTNQECFLLTGKNIVKNTLCTAQSLNTSCKKTKETTCVEGKDEVYFVDSCGNPANIYDSSKVNNQSYWENVVSKENSCNPGSANGNAESKSCGNCYHILGSKCKNYKNSTIKPDLGENVCVDLSCKQAPDLVDAFGKIISKKDRRNGESWCVYDGYIGEGKDVAGSRNFRYSCVEGEVKVEPCADFRNEICVQSDTDISNGKFSSASCRVNTWQSCINANTGKDSKCGEDCEQKTVTIDKFTKSLCTPKYPEGFDFNSEQGSKIGDSICGMASGTCVVQYAAGFMGGCKCVKNCACEKAGFTQQMNDLCISLGDCGGYVNINGKATSEGYSVTGAPRISPEQYGGNAIPVAGLIILAGNINDLISGLGIGSSSGSGSSGGGSNIASAIQSVNLGAAGIGLAVKALSGGLGGILGGGSSGVIVDVISRGATESVVSFTSAAGFSSEFSVSTSAIGTTQAANNIILPASTPVLGEGGATVGTVGQVAAGNSVAAANPLAGAAGFINGLIIGAVGSLIGSFIAKALGLSGMGSLLMSTGFSLLALGLASQYTTWIALGPTLGPAFIIVGIFLIIISLFFGGSKCKPKIVTFTCRTWQPPVGGSDCEKCNSNQELKPCSKYRCESLGKACSLVNEGTTDELCMTNKDDGQAPIIIPLQSALSSNYTYNEISEKGFKIKQNDGNCVEAFTPLSFGIQTNEPAQCKFDLTSKTKYDELEQYFGGSNSLIYNHSMIFSLPSVDSIMYCLNDSNASYQEIANAMKSVKLYTRCQDMFGHYNSAEYLIDICLRPGQDKTAPLIIRTEPASPAYSSYNSSSREISIFTNEPANCKYSKQDKSYSTMENSFQCDNDCTNAGTGWKCSATLGNLSKGENKFYIKCKDQPWLSGENESKRNENSQSYIYTVKSSEYELKINTINPNGTLKFGSEPISIDLEATTSGGAENGKAICEYKFGEGASYVIFYNTDATYHKQVFNQLERGNYNVYVRCYDAAGNTAEKTANLNLEIDDNAPIVTRAYNSGGSLYIYTNENSECAYSNLNCNFIFEDATQMYGGFTQEHSTSWESLKTYYIKCRDAWQHEPYGCSIKIKAYNS